MHGLEISEEADLQDVECAAHVSRPQRHQRIHAPWPQLHPGPRQQYEYPQDSLDGYIIPKEHGMHLVNCCVREWNTIIQPPGLMKMRLVDHQKHHTRHQGHQNNP